MTFLANETNNKTENQTILQRIAAGERGSVQDCFKQYQGLVWHLAEKYIGTTKDTEDAVQEIFIEIWQSAGRYNPEKGKEAAFVTLIAKRRLIDRLRKKARKPETQLIDGIAPRGFINAEKQMQIRLEAKCAKEVLKQFHPNQKKAIDMAIYGGFSHTEIASEMGMPLGTVKTLIRRGFQKMRKNLERRAFPKIATAQ